MAMRAVGPRASATSLKTRSSGSDSTLKAKMPCSKGEGHLVLGLADAGEGDLLGRNADGEHAAKFPLRHHVHAGAAPRERREHAEIGVGLDRVADRARPGPAKASANTR